MCCCLVNFPMTKEAGSPFSLFLFLIPFKLLFFHCGNSQQMSPPSLNFLWLVYSNVLGFMRSLFKCHNSQTNFIYLPFLIKTKLVLSKFYPNKYFSPSPVLQLFKYWMVLNGQLYLLILLNYILGNKHKVYKKDHHLIILNKWWGMGMPLWLISLVWSLDYGTTEHALWGQLVCHTVFSY